MEFFVPFELTFVTLVGRTELTEDFYGVFGGGSY